MADVAQNIRQVQFAVGAESSNLAKTPEEINKIASPSIKICTGTLTLASSRKSSVFSYI